MTACFIFKGIALPKLVLGLTPYNKDVTCSTSHSGPARKPAPKSTISLTWPRPLPLRPGASCTWTHILTPDAAPQSNIEQALQILADRAMAHDIGAIAHLEQDEDVTSGIQRACPSLELQHDAHGLECQRRARCDPIRAQPRSDQGHRRRYFDFLRKERAGGCAGFSCPSAAAITRW